MHRTSGRWISVLACCVLTAALIPVGAWGQTPPVATRPTAPVVPPRPPVQPPPPPADPVAVLKVIPADATAFLAVRNLLELDADIQRLTEKLGFPLAAIGFPGPLDFAKENAGISQGLDDNSGLAIALLSCAALESTKDVGTRLVVFIPCADAEKLTAPMKGQKEGDLIKLELMGKPSVAAVKGGFLIVAQNPDALKEVLQAKGEGIIKTIAPDRLEAYRKQDLFGWASFRGISKAIRDEVLGTLGGLMAMANPRAGAGADNMAQVMAGNTAQMTEGLAKFADECQEVSFGLVVDEKVGLQIVLYSRMRPDTESAQQLAAMKPPTGPLLLGLPDEPVIFAIGGAGSAGNALYEKQMQQMVDKILSPELLGIDKADEAKTKTIKSLGESLVKLITGLEQISASVSNLPVESEDGLVGVAVVARVASAAKAQADVRSIFATGKKLLLDEALKGKELTEEEAKNADAAIQWKENAEKLTGAAVDHFVVDLAKMPSVTQDTVTEVKSVIGREGVLIRVAAVGENHLAVTFGGGAKRFAQIVDLIQKGQAPLAEKKSLKMVADRLPDAKGRLAVAYFSVDRLLALIMDIAGKVGQQIPPLIMEETAPIAYTLTQVDPAAVQVDVLIPVELGQAAMKMAQPFIQMMMMGGMGGPGGPGGPGPNPPMPMPNGELK